MAKPTTFTVSINDVYLTATFRGAPETCRIKRLARDVQGFIIIDDPIIPIKAAACQADGIAAVMTSLQYKINGGPPTIINFPANQGFWLFNYYLLITYLI